MTPIIIIIIIGLITTGCVKEEVFIKKDITQIIPDVCVENKTYCHFMITDQPQVNLTFDVNDTGKDFYYNVSL